MTGRISGEKRVAKVGNNVEVAQNVVHEKFLYLLSSSAHYSPRIPPTSYTTSLHPLSQPQSPKHALPLLSNTNHTASRTATRIARRLTLLMTALAQIVRAGVHDDRPAEHALGPDELDHLVRDGPLGVALAVRLEVSEVADVAFAVGWGAVGFGEGVDWEKGKKKSR